ncbi:MAG: hypothetical protein Q7R90_03155 [bacterium]|nr:hypothetical protein [bacterium]
MSNVLPKEAKKAAWRMYRARFVIAGSLVALAAAGLSALSLLPSYLALHAAGPVNTSLNTAKSASNETDRAALTSIRAMVETLAPLIATTTPTAAITQALSTRPPAISIDHVTYSAGSPGMIILAGTAATREALGGYRQALSANPLWKTVFVPIGDLTGEPGARFSISLSGDF